MIKPVGNRVIVKPKNRGETAAGGRIKLARDEDKPNEGTVVSVGDGSEVKRFVVGDTLVYQKYGPADVKVDGEDYVIVYIDEILGVEEK